MARRSSRAGTYAFYGGLLGAAIGLFVPSMRGQEEFAAILQFVWATVGFVAGMLIGLVAAMATRR